ncbi:1-phosphofructokinase [Caloramator proteoclasticus]|uniref:Tagatose-6-phosphate kinase n=1 Tax=Caloramator proteoclasticus DSM 10124 TaxID=1121262 RepID=A0A1M4XP89_9CLOT|nr:1-phosphofructokinase [Caloramator proteoclasticus]SHE95231.1 fructose-1-phosphate kinase [Caloramator proteoclasticus DSM 10124]
MIYTVTLNPAIDKTIVLDKLLLGNVNRSISSRDDIGGKGINVAKVIKNLGYNVCALGFIGKENSDYIYRKLNKYGVCHDFIEVDGETRTNIKIVEREEGIFTDINQCGFSVDSLDLEKLIRKLKNRVNREDVVVLSGSLPKGIESNVYKVIIEQLKQKDVKVILDAEGQALRYGIEANPYLIKPNINELKTIVNCSEDIEDIKQSVEEFVNKGIVVAVSMGENGALLFSKEQSLYSKPLKVDVKSTVGAGDSMVAAFAIGVHENMPLEDTFRLAIASSTAKVTMEGSQAPNRKEILKYIELVEIQRR